MAALAFVVGALQHTRPNHRVRAVWPGVSNPSANHVDANLTIFDSLAVKLLPPTISGYGNTANPCGDSQADAVSQTESLPFVLSHQLSA